MSKQYSVKQVADLSGITVRTLHHYDKIGLLKPAKRSQKKYRYYDEDNLLRLQQILFYRELDFSLEQTRAILDDPVFDFVKALQTHRESLLQRHKRMKQLIQTVDQTLEKIEGDRTMALKDKDLYKGFDQEKIDRWNKEVDEKYDPEKVAESRRNIGKMSKDQFKDIQKQGDVITEALGQLMDKGADAPEVQEQIKLHHAWIENFYVCPAEMYKGLGQLYIENPEFTAFYEKFKPDLAAFMCEAMGYFADNVLKD
ncbi:MAG: MerR family transcriptional regulator [FCB group bacterium]|nr:MerR family transcriptional regulator [FCB group bacterium]MBL7027326.1 MerR family transcriptional regulator [Candidatus Neomarinimicrobiota bacterium]MBL7122296.1 MerR family transcriptional regulator [Candidatus Neomarinimicrobiota bacterium]